LAVFCWVRKLKPACWPTGQASISSGLLRLQGGLRGPAPRERARRPGTPRGARNRLFWEREPRGEPWLPAGFKNPGGRPKNGPPENQTDRAQGRRKKKGAVGSPTLQGAPIFRPPGGPTGQMGGGTKFWASPSQHPTVEESKQGSGEQNPADICCLLLPGAALDSGTRSRLPGRIRKAGGGRIWCDYGSGGFVSGNYGASAIAKGGETWLPQGERSLAQGPGGAWKGRHLPTVGRVEKSFWGAWGGGGASPLNWIPPSALPKVSRPLGGRGHDFQTT